MNYTCAECKVLSCRKPDKADMPANCPMRDQQEILQEVFNEYKGENLNSFVKTSAYLEADAFGRFPRLKETIIFCQRMKYRHIGIAFCSALAKEATVVSKLLREAGFEVDSVRCKCGGYDKKDLGISPDHFAHKGSIFEPACNPVGQARILDKVNTDFNIVIGLCVGHDSLFLKSTKTMCTVLVVKDRVCGHNPVAPIYLYEHGYWGKMMEEQTK